MATKEVKSKAAGLKSGKKLELTKPLTKFHKGGK
jgi:hypothetical protein